jgi:LAS superfamily LD-carboxypeptidase LdcB
LHGLQPWLSPYADWLVRQFPGVQVTSTYRSYTEQLRLWLTRSSNPYPVAPPGRSFHELGRAFDVVGPIETLNRMGALWERMGGTWGGRIGDRIHFQA